MNPLFSDDQDENSYLLPHSDKRHIKPLSHADNPAVNMLRHKIEALYASEPNAKQELREVEQAHPPRSKHQEFMHRLSTSGRPMAEIQAAWHKYYAGLSDADKHEV